MLVKFTPQTYWHWSISLTFYARVFFVQKCSAQLSLVMFQLCNLRCQNIVAKFVHKMLMKLTPYVNFINVLRTAFTLVDPESVKRY